ncbi:MAG: DUF2867 domain-containing protein [Planctomycetota bacterium]
MADSCGAETGWTLITGATGYVGKRLLRVLEEEGVRARCLARRPEQLATRVRPGTEIVEGDALDASSLGRAMQGVETAYYMIHSMGTGTSFEAMDREAASNFGAAAASAGVRRIIYLGGLGDSSESLSRHLQSRQEVGEILRASGVQVIEFRASIVIGSGSLSFEMIRALVERLPVMVAPRWVSVLAQPIAIDDVLAYLCQAREIKLTGNPIVEIGGRDQVSYGDLMQEYARQRGLRRLIIPVPVLTPRLSSLWLGLVTPLYARVGRALVDSIRHPTVVKDEESARAFRVTPMGYREAIAAALRNEDREIAESRWSDAVSSSGSVRHWNAGSFAPRLMDARTLDVPCPTNRLFAVVERIGGTNGWYYANWLWSLRGAMDLVVGGVGMRRGRPNPDSVQVGDTLDCWRVEAIEPGHFLRLSAEMKLPGRAWLEFEVTPQGGVSRLHQTAIFDPVGVAGRLYWYLVYPLHQIVFEGMIRAIANRAIARESKEERVNPPAILTQVLVFIVFLILCFGAAGVGATWTAESVKGWYQTLTRPSWNPPDWLFGPVWSVLYLMMASSAFLFWRAAGFSKVPAAWTFFGAQLLLNTLWSGIFFAMRNPGLAFAEILFLLAAIAGTMVTFWKRSSWSGLLLVPYFLWCCFAAVLNFALWRLNS